MKQHRLARPLALALILAAGALAPPAQAQSEVVPQGNSDADRLAQDIRLLATNPRDVPTLIDAGVLSARLDDSAAAFAFFARAEAVEPSNPRIAAGRAVALVRTGRPGEALRLFQTAEAGGVAMRDFASDRGFAHDLIGQPLLAQADYRRALADAPDDETVRRLALSLGITGKSDEAGRLLDPLLRRNDRAAWRARAFVLAMNGDVAGAEHIATTMMPGALGQSMTPFFRRLAGLNPADRAFAVHFGELSPTPARIADARLAPAMPAYVPAPPAVAVAAATPRPTAATHATRSRSRSRGGEVAPVAAAPTAVQTAAPATTTPAAAAPVAVAARSIPTAPVQAPPPETNVTVPVHPGATPPVAVVAPTRAEAPSTLPGPTQLAAVAPRTVVTTLPPTARPAGISSAAAAPVTAPAPVPAPMPAAEPAPVPPATPEAAAPTAPGHPVQADGSLDSIVAGIAIPAEELEAVNRPVAVPAPVTPPTRARAEAAPERPVVTLRERPTREKPATRTREADPAEATARGGARKPDPHARPGHGAKADAADEKPGRNAKPDRNDKGDRADKGARGSKGDKPEKAEKPGSKPDPRHPGKGEPSRIWVQVAGGANENDLGKAWKAATAKAPGAFRGRAGWSTPLRATHRVLTGPFKTQAEAQAFVNGLRKQGVSAFVFTSDAGQKVSRLEEK